MNDDSTPGQTGSVFCNHCGSSIFFIFTGGPHKLRCTHCKKVVLLDVTFNGRKWQAKLRHEPIH